MARLKGKNEEIKGNLDQRYWVQKSDPLVLMRSVPFSLGELKVLDTYITAMKEVWRSRDPEFRMQKTAEINATENTKKLGQIYKNVLEKIKSFAPNLIEELGYSDWSEETTKRVQNWIDIVLKGEDPATYGAEPIDTPDNDPFGLTSTPAAPAATEPTTVETTTEDDELPF